MLDLHFGFYFIMNGRNFEFLILIKITKPEQRLKSETRYTTLKKKQKVEQTNIFDFVKSII